MLFTILFIALLLVAMGIDAQRLKDKKRIAELERIIDQDDDTDYAFEAAWHLECAETYESLLKANGRRS